MRLLPFLILPAALGLGFVLGKFTTPSPEPPVLVAAPVALPKQPVEPKLGHYTGSMAELLDAAEAVGSNMINYPLIRAMEDASPTQLAQWAAELTTLHDRYAWRNAEHELLHRWAETDVPAAVAWVKSLPAQDKASAMHQLLSALASHDPQQAQALAASMSNASERATAMTSICEGLATTDPKAAFNLMLSQPDGDQSRNAIHTIFENWGKTDPAAALAALARLTSDSERVHAVDSCFRSWGRHDPAGAMAAAAKLPNQQERKKATSSAFSTWFNTEQGSALTWLEALPAAERSEHTRDEVWRAVALTDAARATALVSGLSGYARSAAFKGMAAQLASRNVDGALSWALSLPSLEDQRAALSDLGPGVVARAGAEKLLWLAERLPEGMGRFDYLQKSLLAVGKERPELIKSVLAGVTEDEAAKLMRNTDLVMFLGRIDPQAAQAWMVDLPPSALRAWAVRTAKEMAEKDPQAALNWAYQLPADQQQNAIASILPKLAELDGPAAYQQALLIQATNPKGEALETVLQVWMNKDPAGPEKVLPALTGKARKFVLFRIASKKIQDDPEAGFTHLLTLGNSAKQEETEAAVDAVGGLCSLAVSDPASATAWFHRLPAGEMQERFLNGMANHWLQQNPTACLAWMNQLPEGATRDLGLQITAQEWISRDLDAATEWITTLPEGKVKDQAARNIVDREISDHPDQAATWAQRIQAAEAREQALSYVYSNWLNWDPTAATKTLEKANLPADFKEKLLHPPPENADPFAP